MAAGRSIKERTPRSGEAAVPGEAVFCSRHLGRAIFEEVVRPSGGMGELRLELRTDRSREYASFRSTGDALGSTVHPSYGGSPYDILGERNVGLFGNYFPIRFDYLDTMQGGELSLQVHPLQAYVESTFNEHMTQQESYYIMRNAPGAKVYLGLKEGVTGEKLLEAVEHTHSTREPLTLSSYANEYESEKGNLYLIPPGTVHCSGRDNLVLEISSTTWWFTFKIYDYLRLDADGKPRPMNLEHARHNINDAMDTSAVEGGLIARPIVVSRQGRSTEELLGQRGDLLFQVSRLSLQNTWHADTRGEFVMYNLVDGERVRLVPADNEAAAVEWGYAEAYIVPASVGEYRLENLSDSPCTLIAARVNPEWSLPLLPPTWNPSKEASHELQ